MVCDDGPRVLCGNGLRTCPRCPLRKLDANSAESHRDANQGDLPGPISEDYLLKWARREMFEAMLCLLVVLVICACITWFALSGGFP